RAREPHRARGGRALLPALGKDEGCPGRRLGGARRAAALCAGRRAGSRARLSDVEDASVPRRDRGRTSGRAHGGDGAVPTSNVEESPLIHRAAEKGYSRKPIYSFADRYALGPGQRADVRPKRSV